MRGIGYGEDFFVIKKDEELIKEHLTRLIMTTNGERVNNYGFGSLLREYLFNFTPVILQDIEDKFYDMIGNKMPEIEVFGFSVIIKDEHTLSISFNVKKKESLEKFLYKQDFQVE